jgi:hypothetical protein
MAVFPVTLNTDQRGIPVAGYDYANDQIKVLLNSLIAGEDLFNDVLKVEHQYKYALLAGPGTTVIKNATGFLHTIVLFTTAAGAATFYDNTAGSGQQIAALPASAVVGPYGPIDVTFNTGLTAVLAAASVILVSYR